MWVHRSLTRRVIEAFPGDDAFATLTIGGMRPFVALEDIHARLGGV